MPSVASNDLDYRRLMPLRAQAYSSVIGREVTGEKHIPFAAQVDRWTLKTHQGDYIQTYRLEGIAHETAHDDEIERWHEQLALFMRNLNSPHLALWSYVVRRETAQYVDGEFEPGFAQDFNDRYRERVTQRRMYVNELYLAIVYRPEVSAAARAAERMDPAFRDKAKLLNPQTLRRNSTALERINSFAGEIEKYLRRYGPERLGSYAFDYLAKREYRHEDEENAPRHAQLCSEQLEFYGYVLNGEWQRTRLLRADVAQTLQTSRITVGNETIELRTPVGQSYGAMLAWKEYPDPSFPGQLNELLRAPFEFVLAQSFTCLEKSAARGALKRQYNRLESTEDDAISETDALHQAIDGLASNQFAMGTHHLELFLRASSPRELTQVVGEARRALSDSGAVVVREELACEAAFYSLLAGNFGDRPRPSDMTSRNFLGFSSFHNYPSGRRDGNHWGPALGLLKTASGAPYYLSLHRRDIGHFAMFGSTGAGKTVLAMFLLVMLQKTGATIILFDKDRGAEICVRALKGHYFQLRKGYPTGFNPFLLAASPENRDFVQRLVRVLVRSARAPFTARENAEIARAVDGVFQLPSVNRRLASVLAFLDPPTADNVAARLLRWVHADRGTGQLAWVFDNPLDTLDLTQVKLAGFDMTHFLDDPEVRTPLLMYLFHRINALKDGRRGGVIIDEGWKALDDEEFVASMGDSLKTDRKKDWFFGLITQSPKDSLGSRIAHTIAEQTPTKFFLPNLNARHDDYVKGFGCSEGEFETIRRLSESGRRFLVKQGDNAVVCELDLTGFDDDLAVFSGTQANTALLDRIRERVGDDPSAWLPVFHVERKRL